MRNTDFLLLVFVVILVSNFLFFVAVATICWDNIIAILLLLLWL